MKLAARLTGARRAYLRNVVAHLGGLYGAKGFELVILAAVSRAASLTEVGAVFYAVAFGNALFQLVDFGLFPVLFRRAARGQVGPSLLAQATLARAAGVLALTLPFLFFARAKFPEREGLATTFFLLAGLHIVHEIPRAVIAGRERFVWLASAGLATKALEAGTTLVGVALGAGVWAWAIGRAVQNVAMLVISYAIAHREVRGCPSPRAGSALREGFPFWFSTGIGSTLAQLDTLVVGTYLGLAETARLGIAGRVVGGALGVVGSMMNVAFPEIARQNRRFPSGTQVRTVLATAVGLTLPVFFAAPLLVRVVTGRFDSEASAIVRALAPVIAFSVLDRALTTWLQAKNKERGIALVATLGSLLSALALIVLIPAFRTPGAAYSRVFREVVTSFGLLALALVTARRVASPLAWSLAKVPGAGALVRARLSETTAAVTRELVRDPRVLGVEVSGSGWKPDSFEPGASDLDFIVTTRATGGELDAVTRHCDDVARRVRFTGAAHVQLAHPAVLEWARRAGHPVLSAVHVRVLHGSAHDSPREPASTRAWELTHAAALALRMQGYVLEDARHDGATRGDRVAKEFRFILHRLGGGDIPRGFQELRERGHDLPDFLARPRSAPPWLSPALTGDLLRATHDVLGAAFREASADFHAAPRDQTAPAWLTALSDVAKPYTRVPPGTAVQLTPTGPTDDDPMLVIAAPAWTREEWLAWVVETSALGRLPLPFRAYRWPAVLPEGVLAADCLVEHAALFHLSRRSRAQDLVGTATRGLVPPDAVLRAAAERETLQALVRITRDRTRVSRLAVFRQGDLTEPGSIVDAWPFRVRALVGGRLASLSLLLDHGLGLPDRDTVRAAYVERYDDPLASLLREDPAETSGSRIAEVLDAWALARIERLSRTNPSSL